MFKKLREKFFRKDAATSDPDGKQAAAAQEAATAEFIAVMESFERTAQPYHELVERARVQAGRLADTGKVERGLSGQLQDALTDIRATEAQIQETREAAGDLSGAALARFETAAGRIAVAHAGIEDAIKALKLAKIEFDSLRDDDDDYDDDFDGD